jgi:hypothetical protein
VSRAGASASADTNAEVTPDLMPLQSRGSGMGGFSWEDVVSSGTRSREAAEEAFYGFGDFFRDLDKDR